nr:MAG: putative coat protein [Tombusviridae sp.]
MAGGSALRRKVPRPTKAKAQPKARTPPSRKLEMVEHESAFGPVGRIASAPVNIGTTIRSVPAFTKVGRDSVMITGRDFVGTLMGVSTSFNSWVFSGGFPVSPYAFTASALKGYFLTYQTFKVRRLVLHYISSSPTSSSGDILMLHHSNRAGPYVDHTSSNFMSYAMSTPSAVLGPQWLNKSIEVVDSDTYGWLETDMFNAEDVAHQAAGEVLVYTKNTTNGTQADSPGYILIDYQIEFAKKMVNPRSTTLPTTLGKIWVTSLGQNATAVTGASLLSFDFFGNNYDGTAGLAPPGIENGMIFKVGFDTQFASTWTNVTVNTLALFTMGRNDTGTITASGQLVFKVGMTLYGVYFSSTNELVMYDNYDAALAGNALRFGTSATVTFQMPAWMSLVGSLSSGLLQSSI